MEDWNAVERSFVERVPRFCPCRNDEGDGAQNEGDASWRRIPVARLSDQSYSMKS